MFIRLIAILVWGTLNLSAYFYLIMLLFKSNFINEHPDNAAFMFLASIFVFAAWISNSTNRLLKLIG